MTFFLAFTFPSNILRNACNYVSVHIFWEQFDLFPYLVLYMATPPFLSTLCMECYPLWFVFSCSLLSRNNLKIPSPLLLPPLSLLMCPKQWQRKMLLCPKQWQRKMLLCPKQWQRKMLLCPKQWQRKGGSKWMNLILIR